MSALEVKTERDVAFGLAEGGQVECVRVKYRKPPTRRWTRFLLIPDDGQPLEELEHYAADAAALHASRDWRMPSERLRGVAAPSESLPRDEGERLPQERP